MTCSAVSFIHWILSSKRPLDQRAPRIASLRCPRVVAGQAPSCGPHRRGERAEGWPQAQSPPWSQARMCKTAENTQTKPWFMGTVRVVWPEHGWRGAPGCLWGREGRGSAHAHGPAEDRMPAGSGPLAFLTRLLLAKPLWEQEETMDLAPSGCEQAIREALGGHVLSFPDSWSTQASEPLELRFPGRPRTLCLWCQGWGAGATGGSCVLSCGLQPTCGLQGGHGHPSLSSHGPGQLQQAVMGRGHPSVPLAMACPRGQVPSRTGTLRS